MVDGDCPTEKVSIRTAIEFSSTMSSDRWPSERTRGNGEFLAKSFRAAYAQYLQVIKFSSHERSLLAGLFPARENLSPLVDF